MRYKIFLVHENTTQPLYTDQQHFKIGSGLNCDVRIQIEGMEVIHLILDLENKKFQVIGKFVFISGQEFSKGQSGNFSDGDKIDILGYKFYVGNINDFISTEESKDDFKDEFIEGSVNNHLNSSFLSFQMNKSDFKVIKNDKNQLNENQLNENNDSSLFKPIKSQSSYKTEIPISKMEEQNKKRLEDLSRVELTDEKDLKRVEELTREEELKGEEERLNTELKIQIEHNDIEMHPPSKKDLHDLVIDKQILQNTIKTEKFIDEDPLTTFDEDSLTTIDEDPLTIIDEEIKETEVIMELEREINDNYEYRKVTPLDENKALSQVRNEIEEEIKDAERIINEASRRIHQMNESFQNEITSIQSDGVATNDIQSMINDIKGNEVPIESIKSNYYDNNKLPIENTQVNKLPMKNTETNKLPMKNTETNKLQIEGTKSDVAVDENRRINNDENESNSSDKQLKTPILDLEKYEREKSDNEFNRIEGQGNEGEREMKNKTKKSKEQKNDNDESDGINNEESDDRKEDAVIRKELNETPKKRGRKPKKNEENKKEEKNKEKKINEKEEKKKEEKINEKEEINKEKKIGEKIKVNERERKGRGHVKEDKKKEEKKRSPAKTNKTTDKKIENKKRKGDQRNKNNKRKKASGKK